MNYYSVEVFQKNKNKLTEDVLEDDRYFVVLEKAIARARWAVDQLSHCRYRGWYTADSIYDGGYFEVVITFRNKCGDLQGAIEEESFVEGEPYKGDCLEGFFDALEKFRSGDRFGDFDWYSHKTYSLSRNNGGFHGIYYSTLYVYRFLFHDFLTNKTVRFEIPKERKLSKTDILLVKKAAKEFCKERQ